MKKLLVLGLVVGGFAAMTSCKKDYTCECTTSDSSGLLDPVTTSSTINGKKKDVKTACENGNTSVGTLSTSCKIK